MRLKNGEFQFGFSGLGKNRGVDGLQTENKNKLKCKIEPLEVSGHWFRVLRQPNMSSGLFPRVGEDDIQSFPEPNLHFALKTKSYDFPF